MSNILPAVRSALLRSRRRLATVALAGTLGTLVAACGSSASTALGSGTTSRPGSRTTALPVTSSQTTVRVGHTALGAVLVTDAGKTLYHPSADHGTTIACGASCTPIWPLWPWAPARPRPLVPGLASSLTTVMRADGTRQVTYNGLTLYTYAGASGAGQTKGQGVVEHYGSVTVAWSAVPSMSSSSAAASPATTVRPGTATATTKAPSKTVAPPTTKAPATTQAPSSTTRATTTTQPSETTTTVSSWG